MLYNVNIVIHAITLNKSTKKLHKTVINVVHMTHALLCIPSLLRHKIVLCEEKSILL